MKSFLKYLTFSFFVPLISWRHPVQEKEPRERITRFHFNILKLASHPLCRISCQKIEMASQCQKPAQMSIHIWHEYDQADREYGFDSSGKGVILPLNKHDQATPLSFLHSVFGSCKTWRNASSETKSHEGNTFISQFLKKSKELYSRNKYIPFCRTTTSCHIISCHDFISWWQGSWALAKKGSVCSMPGLFYAMKWAY